MKYILLLAVLYLGLSSFCGFYVAKADIKLFNKSSQVILVRNGEKTVITMSNDFQGDVKDFAMVVPVPTVLQRDQITIADQNVFDRLDAYSGPRLVEYHDRNPCIQPRHYAVGGRRKKSAAPQAKMDRAENMPEPDPYQVKIEATYTVGEYDILILSAKESGGLQRWLTDNGYKIPPGAEEVLEPYIKSDMKFFVVKVNLAENEKRGSKNLRPLQLTVNSPKFMLPIRLGMANSDGYQDLIVYAFSKVGRVETTNYRTEKIPTDRKVPLFVKDEFGQFYKSLFDRAWQNTPASVFLEYSWDISSSNYVHCDPCSSTPPLYAELQKAGVDWVQSGNKQGYNISDYQGDVYFTRLHVRYDRKNFPQDLVFQETPNKESFQGRYILTHPATGVDCDKAYQYYYEVYDRRVKEVQQLAELTGWETLRYRYYADEYKTLIEDLEDRLRKDGRPIPNVGRGSFENVGGAATKFWSILLILGASSLVFYLNRKR